MGFLLGGLGIALGGCSPLFEGDTTTATGNNTENSLIQNEQSLEQFKIILSGEADLIEDEGYGTNYLTLLQEGNCSSYRNEEYGFQLTLPDEWNNCKLIRNVFIAPDNTILVDFTLNFFSEMNKEWKISDGELLPI
ncbi:MAG: hypothetical protein LBP53_05830 [Candidatus Peribacteria bacterium]|nr:hypothetical protein [Candidatus Peribacteria bacterium]